MKCLFLLAITMYARVKYFFYCFVFAAKILGYDPIQKLKTKLHLDIFAGVKKCDSIGPSSLCPFRPMQFFSWQMCIITKEILSYKFHFTNTPIPN